MTEALESPSDEPAQGTAERVRQLERQVDVLRSLLDQEREQRRRELLRGAEELDELRDQRRADAVAVRRLRSLERRHEGTPPSPAARVRRAVRRRSPQVLVRASRALRRRLR